MAHNIFSKCVYSFARPMWHGLTKPSEVEMSAVGVLDNQFAGGFPVHLRPVTVELNGEAKETGDFAIVRGSSTIEPDEAIFGYCTNRYQPLQPRAVAETFDDYLNLPVETMAFLGNGNDMFISWKMPTFEVVNDEIEMYGIVRTGFDTMKGTSLFTSTYRPVCQNTINLAEGWAKTHTDGNGRGNIWKGKGVNKELLTHLGYWMKFVKDNSERESMMIQNFFGKLAKTPVKKDEDVYSILFEAYPPAEKLSAYYPPELRKDKEETIETFNEKQGEIRDGIFQLFSGVGTAITPDFYGVMNATSEYFCHYQPSKKAIAQSVMFGNRQKQTMRVIDVMSSRI